MGSTTPNRSASAPKTSEGPADGASADADLRLTVEPLDPGRPLPLLYTRRRALLNGLSLAAALALLLVGIAYFHPASPVTHQLPPSLPPTPQPPRGWTIASPGYAETIVFAPSSPATAYACGAYQLNEPGSPSAVSVGVSHDYGHTWTLLPTPLLSPWCDITVNPTDPRDVVLITAECASCGTIPTLRLYRTTNGGDNWSLWPLPAHGSNGPAEFTNYQWAWAGSTLFIAPSIRGNPGYDVLAASVAQQPFAWVGQQGLFAGQSQGASIDSLTGIGAVLIVTFDCLSGCGAQAGFQPMQTHDGGATWSRFSPTVAGQPVYLANMGTSSTALFGSVGLTSSTPAPQTRYVWSTDQGVTWRLLPATPDTGALGVLYMLAAPDGTVYAGLWNCCSSVDLLAQEGLYRLAPGAAAWTYLGPFPGDASKPIVLSWNPAGHPLALWGSAYESSAAYAVVPGIERHLP